MPAVLHDANVLVGQDDLKVLDPLYFNTALLASTGSRQDQQKKDVRDVRDLLLQLLAATPLGAQGASQFQEASHNPNLSALRAAFFDALDAAVGTASARDSRPSSGSPRTHEGASVGTDEDPTRWEQAQKRFKNSKIGVAILVLVAAAGAVGIVLGAGSAVRKLFAEEEDGILRGDFRIQNTKDVVDFQRYSEITGTLSVAGQGLTEVRLPKLERIGVGLSIRGANQLTVLALPALRTVGDDLNLDSNDTLEVLDLRSIETVQGIFNLQDTRLVSLSLPDLVAVGGHFMLDNNRLLETVTAPKLVRVGRDLDIKGNIRLPTIDLPALESVRANIHVIENSVLRSLRGLRSLSTKLTGVTFRIVNNPQLPTCEATDLLDRVGSERTKPEIAGNNDKGVCR